MKSKKKIVISAGGIILILGLVLALWWLLSKFVFVPKITSVQVANLADQSTSLVFWSDRPARFTVKIKKGDGKISAVTEGNKDSRVHEIDFSSLSPNSDYSFEIDQTFGQKAINGNFKTLPLVRKISLPKTVYGTVQEIQQPSIKALVTLKRVFLKTSPQLQSLVLATTTNDSGNFVFDLNNAPIANIPQGAEERLEVKVWSQDGKMAENLFSTSQVQPLPTIEMK